MPNVIQTSPAPNNAKPKGIAILLGWFGAHPKHLSKYSNLYTERGFTTVACIADKKAIMLIQKAQLRRFALDIVSSVSKQQAAAEDTVPVIVHTFSGGGCLVLEQLEKLLLEAKSGNQCELDSEQVQRLNILGEGIQRGGKFFDSGPCYGGLRNGSKAIENAISNPILRYVLVAVFRVYFLIVVLLSFCFGRRHPAVEHWKHLEDSSVSCHQAYLYDKDDEMIDHDKLQQLIAHRQKKNAGILVRRLTNSQHCAHLRKCPQEYTAFLEKFLSTMPIHKKNQSAPKSRPNQADCRSSPLPTSIRRRIQ